MGAQWKQAGREANAQKKGQMVAKLTREIMVAAKLGGADPDLNARLASGALKNRAGHVVREKLDGGLLRQNRQVLYPIRNHLPVLLIEEAIPLG